MEDNKQISLVLLSENVFTAISMQPIDGFVAIQNEKIVAVGTRENAEKWTSNAQRVIDLGNKVISPGFVDVHTFFSGWVLRSIGVDFGDIKSDVDGVKKIKQYIETQKPNAVFGHCWQADDFVITNENILNEEFPEMPIVIFTFERDRCWMNNAAQNKYQFTSQECWAEKIWRMMPQYLTMPGVEEKYIEYMQMLNERGITTIKEMTFDDYYGFADVMEKLEKENKMTLRVSMMSQPVGKGIDIEHGKAMQKRFNSSFLSFSGYNRMTDRGIPSFMGELIEPYKSRPEINCLVPVEWDLIERETLLADKNGFRYSLHCQGDGAVRHTVELYDKCEKVNGKLKNRHAITDLEYSNPEDLARFGKMGGITEVYAQIQSLDNKQDVLDMIERQLGSHRGINYWNRRKMWDSGICVSCGTDLPLLIPDIPQAIACGCKGMFNDGESYNEQNMLTVPEMLVAWTKNGQYNCYNEDRLGTLQEGMLADIAVLDSNVFDMSYSQIKQAKVCLTVQNGRIVYENL